MRVYYMDALRSVLMALGVVFHASALYLPSHPWRVPEAGAHPLFEWLYYGIHTFRMPAFFLISGYFCLLTLRKYGENRFLRQRVVRIGIPLLATAVLINPWMNYFSWGNYRRSGFLDYVLDPAYLSEGTWIGHLWFLNNLLIYFALAFLAVKLLRLRPLAPLRRAPARLIELWSTLRGRMLLLALLLPLTNMGVPRMAWRLGIDEGLHLGGFIDLASLGSYLPYFLLGMLMRQEPLLIQTLASGRFWLTALALAAVSAALPAGGYATYAWEYAGYALAWGLVGLCLALFRRLFDRPSPGFEYFADASYTIYLLHQLLVVLLGWALVSAPISIFAKFALIVGLTFALTAAAHHYLVLRIPLLRLLFNGKTDVAGGRRRLGAPAEPGGGCGGARALPESTVAPPERSPTLPSAASMAPVAGSREAGRGFPGGRRSANNGGN